MDNQRVLPDGNAIVIKGLTKQFDDVTAVDGLDLEIRRGEMFGFLGPNGAGKTTTISMLCGLLAPTSGSAEIAGFDIGHEPRKVKELIGVCPQEAAVFKFLTDMDRQALRQRAADLVEQADFAEAAGRRTKGYSGGMKRQLNLRYSMTRPGTLPVSCPTTMSPIRYRSFFTRAASLNRSSGRIC